MSRARAAWLASVVAVLVLAQPPAVGASLNVHQTMLLTVNVPVRLPGVTLAPGRYVFELADPMGAGNLVRVLSGDRHSVYLLAFTYRVDRPRDLRPDQVVTLGEAPAGSPAPILVWYPRYDRSGRQFIYPDRQ